MAPAAFHKLPRGSSGAIVLLTEQLIEFPQDLTARWLLNLAYMTLGEYPDKVPAQWLIPPKTFQSDCDFPHFPDVAAALGVNVYGLSGGCILDDFDNDGLIDIVTSTWGLDSSLHYFHNDGDGHFSDRTVEAGLAGLMGGLNIQQTDYNNDGLLDIWVLRGAWNGKVGRIPPSLLRNNGDGTFTDVTEEAGLLSAHPTQTSVWFDFDGDGWLDLFIGHETTDPNHPDPCELYHCNHDGTFTQCAAACGIRVNRFVKGVTCLDYDNDGRFDLRPFFRTASGLIRAHRFHHGLRRHFEMTTLSETEPWRLYGQIGPNQNDRGGHDGEPVVRPHAGLSKSAAVQSNGCGRSEDRPGVAGPIYQLRQRPGDRAISQH